MQLLELETLANASEEISSPVVYGGTFDPIHQGHIGVITELLEVFPILIIAPTASNPFKADQPTSLYLRLQMLRIALAEYIPSQPLLSYRGGTLQPGIYLYERGYRYAKEVVEDLRKQSTLSHLYWAIGEDLTDEVRTWKDWDRMNVSMVIAKIRTHIHASEIRSNQAALLPCLRSFASQYNLYPE